MNGEDMLRIIWDAIEKRSAPLSPRTYPVALDDLIRRGTRPVYLLDGHYGLLINFGLEVGIQVPGEQDIRWLPLSAIQRTENNALIEVPTFKCETCSRLEPKLTCTVNEQNYPTSPAMCDDCRQKLDSGRYELLQEIGGRVRFIQVCL